MSDAARTTQRTYDAIAEAFLERTSDLRRSRPWLDHFAAALPPGALVADVGSGPGRDTHGLRACGLRAIALDRSRGMLRAGRARFPADRVQADLLALPLRPASVAGVWANACLLHLPEAEMPAALAEIRRVLVPGGRLHLTLKRGEGAGWETERYGGPRFFQYWTGEALDAVLADAGFGVRIRAFAPTPSADWLVRQCTLRD